MGRSVAPAAGCRATIDGSAIPVLWTWPVSTAERSALGRWCRGVGPVVIDVVAAPAQRSGSGVTVVTWNTHVGAGDLAALVDALRSGGLTGTPAADFVLLLQEAVRRSNAVPMPLRADAAFAGRIGFEPEGLDVVEAARGAGLNVVY